MQRFCSRGEPITETKTLACCRSPDTSARVTVTPLTRGSRSSKRIVSLATSRMASETRARRCIFMMVGPCRSGVPPDLHFQLVVQKLGRRLPSQGFHDFVQRSTHVVALVAD